MPSSFTSPTHFNIVALETFFTPMPTLSVPSPHTFSLTTYDKTIAAEVPARITDADILITTSVALRAETLSAQVCPRLKLIVVIAAGTDTTDLDACARRGIRVLSCPNCNKDAVAEHAIALYFAVRRSIMPTMRGLLADEWPQRGSLMRSVFMAERPPRACRDETVAIVGNGAVGKRVSELCTALGMQVVVAARKGASASEGKVAFDVALKTATVVFVCCPRTPETMNLLSGPEFVAMPQDAVLVNVSRGGVVDEGALLTALKQGDIGGASVDVFAMEPASSKTSPLLTEEVKELNLVLTPHMAWVGGETTANYHKVLQENIDGFILGTVQEERVRA
ncbi:hypothetical protein AK830_g1319 [Neonectria ditissima]|uniref:Glycerate dehydrogenase n=1 Tax=Neonectria ditissima TaxID=78410 RepID=A0A0P7BX18_9HYPO|nr:hypothetical protein AK830_g1319 [Neonectria ditissima]